MLPCCRSLNHFSCLGGSTRLPWYKYTCTCLHVAAHDDDDDDDDDRDDDGADDLMAMMRVAVIYLGTTIRKHIK